MSTCVVLRCDQCGELARNWLSPTASAARDAARNEGWRRSRRPYENWKDLCPRCLSEDELRDQLAAAADVIAGMEGDVADPNGKK